MKKHTILMTVLCLIFICLGSVSVSAAEEYYTEGYFKYTISQKEIILTGYFGSEKEVVIPEKIAELPITTIRKSVFNGNKAIENITVPETVKKVEAGAFMNIPKLKMITNQSKDLSFDVPDVVIVKEDFPVYIDTDKETEKTEATQKEDTQKEHTQHEETQTATSEKSDAVNGNIADKIENNTVGYEIAGEELDKEYEGVELEDEKILTVDDTNNLIVVDKNQEIFPVDRNKDYHIVKNDGKITIVDNDGTEVTVNKDTITYVDDKGTEIMVDSKELMKAEELDEETVAGDKSEVKDNEEAAAQTTEQANSKQENRHNTNKTVAIVITVMIVLFAGAGIFLYCRKRKG